MISNANLFRYKAAGMADTSILSTGTWMIGFQRGLALDKLDATRGMVLNIDVDGENVPSTLIATGREYDLISRDHDASDAAVLTALPSLLALGTRHSPPSLGMTDCSPVQLTADALSDRGPRRQPNGRGWQSSTPHSVQTAV